MPNASPLPEWDLTDFYQGISDPALEREFSECETWCLAFAEAYGSKVETLESTVLAQALMEFERISERMGKIGSYAQLLFSGAMNDPQIGQFYQNAQERLTDYSSHTLFFTLALNKIDDAVMAKHLAHAGVAHYAPLLRDIRSFRPYQLSDEIEKLLHEKSVAGRSAWIRLFDEHLSGLKVKIAGENLLLEQALDLLSNRDGAKRKTAALAIGKVFKQHAPQFALITNTLAKDKEIEDRWRKFPKPISSRNVANFIEDEVVEALLGTVTKNFPKLSHRYYKLKAGWLGRLKLDYWDRNAPLPSDLDHSYGWEEARELVLSSYRHFSPTLADVGERFFTKNWIDAPVKPGKTGGAFSHPTVPSVHPYILMNFQGKSRDVMTLAHELGHGVHQVLAGKQGALMSDTPLTLAETASVFGEQLTFREMIRREKDAERKRILIAGKVEDMLNTVVRQIAFCRFETLLHDARKNGELTAEQISDIWMKVQKESLGAGIKLGGNYRYFWTYISHFVHSPFYVYAYAFGDCLVNSLYAVYEQSGKAGKGAEFEKKYIQMLEAGGTLRHKELLAPFGLDATRPDFWQQGLNVISSLIDELE